MTRSIDQRLMRNLFLFVCLAGTSLLTAQTIDQGGSTLCSGTLYDSGGPNGNYLPNEEHTFQICPDVPSPCITLTLEYYQLEDPAIFGTGDYLTFFDGNNIGAPQIAQVGGFGGLGGGAVCYTVQAYSGCLTVQFQSDETNEFKGWKGTWNCSDQPCASQEPLNVNTNITYQDIVNAVNTPFATVKVTNVQCPNGAYGTFQFATDNNALGLNKGLILTSGLADNAIGANNKKDAGTKHSTPGDADLNLLSNGGSLSSDACVVELDIFATSDELTFEYVFASEEYPEFANKQFNDIFAFLISGPGIVGDPGLGNQKNIAIIPGTINQPVEVNSINHVDHWPYYRNNPAGAPSLQYDGLTSDSLGKKKSLTARATVIPCNTYHLKLAIADRFDGLFDSGVFISEIKGGSPQITTRFDDNLPYLIEGCSAAGQQIEFTLSEAFTDTVKYFIQIGGTATPGLDYLLNLQDSIVFLPGQTTLSFSITQLPDNLIEGPETVVIALVNHFGCDPVIFDTLAFEIRDKIEVNIMGGDTLQVCLGQQIMLEATGTTDYIWTPPGAVSDPFTGNPTIQPTQDLWLKVEGKTGNCPAYDSIFIQVFDPKIEVLALADSRICLGTSVPLQAMNNVNNLYLQWSPIAGLSDPSSPTPSASPATTTTYRATVGLEGCLASDSVTILVDTLFFPTIIQDVTICQNYSVRLANVIFPSTTKYDWTPTVGLDNPKSSGPIATPDQTTTYTLVASSANGFCEQVGTVTVTVSPADIDIEGPEYREICLGTPVTLTAQSAPPGALVTWSPNFYVSPAVGPTVTATLDESATIFATYSINGCTVTDSVRIRVDSLPYSELFLKPDKPLYCPGDTVILFSNTYQPAHFPDIRYEWEPFGGQETEKDLWNMVISATMTHTFIRNTVNHACMVTDSVEVPVGERPEVTITATPNNICPGETVQLNATVQPDQKLKWEDNGLLSCLECPDPKVTPFSTTTFQVNTPDANCPTSVGITVNVLPLPGLNIASNPIICLGDSVLLNSTPAEPNVTYIWTASIGNPPVGATPKVAPTQATTYTITAKGPKCISSGTTTVTPVSATLEAGSDINLCLGETAILAATITGTQGGLVRWEPGALFGYSVPVTPASTTTYTATLTYGPNCQSVDQLTVSVNPAQLLLTLPPNATICPGDSILLNSAPVEPNVTYTWTTSTGTVPIGYNPTVAPSQTTTYKVTAASAQCKKTAETTVNVASAIVNAGPDQTICFGQTVALNAVIASVVTPSDVLTWLPANFKGNPFNTAPLQTTVYTVRLQYGPGCETTDAIQVTVNPAVQLSAITGTPKPAESICEGVAVVLKVNVIPDSATLVWLENGVVLPGLTTDSALVKPAGDGVSVKYTVVATSAAGCSSTAGPLSYQVERCFAIPNAFTPNGDALNPNFGLVQYGGEVTVEYFAVYDRWGKQVFESRSKEKRWDGRYKDTDAPSDVYAYVMRVRFPNGDLEEIKGDVTLIR